MLRFSLSCLRWRVNDLSSAVRLFVLDHYRRLTELGLTVKPKR